MLELSNSNALTLNPNESVVFNLILLHTGCAECFRQNTGSVNLTQRNAVYEIGYNCNIGATEAGTAEVALTLNGSELPETLQQYVTVAAGDLQGVGASTFVQTCCCGNVAYEVKLTNVGTTTINLTNPRLSSKRLG